MLISSCAVERIWVDAVVVVLFFQTDMIPSTILTFLFDIDIDTMTSLS